MIAKIRLGCNHCDREDFDGIDELPSDWTDIHEVRSFDEAIREVDVDDQSRSVFDWQTHLGVCPECQAIHG
jgi:hypothetical protein